MKQSSPHPLRLMSRRPLSSRFLGPLVAALIVGSGLSISSTALADEVAITDNARNHFKAGVNLMQDPDGARYEEALVEFRTAYADSPSWKILGNLGICAMKLERDGEAIEAFETYLREGGNDIEEADREQFQRDLETLTAGVTWISISVLPRDARIVDRRIPVAGRSTENRYSLSDGSKRIGVHAGQHEITASLKGYESQTWSFAARGGELSHSFELKAIEEDKPIPVANSSVMATASSAHRNLKDQPRL